MNQSHVVIVDDDSDVSDVTRLMLTDSEVRVSVAASAKECLELIGKKKDVDLILLDIMMPEINGLDLMQILSQEKETASIPIILHSSVGDEDVVVKGLELGAQDYIAKNTSPRIKLSRIKAALRRTQNLPEPTTKSQTSIKLKELELHFDKRTLQTQENTIELSKLELRILKILMGRPGALVNNNELLSAVRQEFPKATTKGLDSTLTSLRGRLGNANRRIEKVLGVGYRFRLEM
jgi:DNA-binding response OmpR family regulator